LKLATLKSLLLGNGSHSHLPQPALQIASMDHSQYVDFVFQHFVQYAIVTDAAKIASVTRVRSA